MSKWAVDLGGLVDSEYVVDALTEDDAITKAIAKFKNDCPGVHAIEVEEVEEIEE